MTEKETPGPICPSCQREGIECLGTRKVPNPRVTLASLVKEGHRDALSSEGPVYFCVQRDCPTVYFDAEGRQIKKGHLVVGVWQKEKSLDVPVCYCFNYTAGAIVEDARGNSPPVIPRTIRDKIKAGECQCDVKNPEGSCCLGNVAYWVKQRS